MTTEREPPLADIGTELVKLERYDYEEWVGLVVSPTGQWTPWAVAAATIATLTQSIHDGNEAIEAFRFGMAQQSDLRKAAESALATLALRVQWYVDYANSKDDVVREEIARCNIAEAALAAARQEGKFKIVTTDNFGRDNQVETLVANNIKSKTHGEIMLAALQATGSDHDPVWYKLVSADYVLSRGIADLMDTGLTPGGDNGRT